MINHFMLFSLRIDGRMVLVPRTTTTMDKVCQPETNLLADRPRTLWVKSWFFQYNSWRRLRPWSSLTEYWLWCIRAYIRLVYMHILKGTIWARSICIPRHGTRSLTSPGLISLSNHGAYNGSNSTQTVRKLVLPLNFPRIKRIICRSQLHRPQGSR